MLRVLCRHNASYTQSFYFYFVSSSTIGLYWNISPISPRTRDKPNTDTNIDGIIKSNAGKPDDPMPGANSQATQPTPYPATLNTEVAALFSLSTESMDLYIYRCILGNFSRLTSRFVISARAKLSVRIDQAQKPLMKRKRKPPDKGPFGFGSL